MAIRLHIGKETSESERESVLHLMPCKIDGDEPANVSKYFVPYISEVKDDYLRASFRGYPLQGRKVKVPDGYTGYTFYEYEKPTANRTQRNLYSTGKFYEFTYWNYDRVPSRNDALSGALDWIDVAEALHSTEEPTKIRPTGIP